MSGNGHAMQKVLPPSIDPWDIIRLVGEKRMDYHDCRLVDAIASGRVMAGHKPLARLLSVTPRTVKLRLAKLRILLTR